MRTSHMGQSSTSSLRILSSPKIVTWKSVSSRRSKISDLYENNDLITENQVESMQKVIFTSIVKMLP